MVNELGSAREAALAGLVFVPVAVAAFPAQPTARTARPAATAATARRVVVFSMVPPVCRRSPWTVRRRKGGRHRGCHQGGTVASTDLSSGSGATIRSWHARRPHRPARHALPHLAVRPSSHALP